MVRLRKSLLAGQRSAGVLYTSELRWAERCTERSSSWLAEFPLGRDGSGAELFVHGRRRSNQACRGFVLPDGLAENTATLASVSDNPSITPNASRMASASGKTSAARLAPPA